jgi:hypothetical protein
MLERRRVWATVWFVLAFGSVCVIGIALVWPKWILLVAFASLPIGLLASTALPALRSPEWMRIERPRSPGTNPGE